MANFYVSSGTSFSATINITYPSGSTCTVTNYKKTWTAPNTSGSWTFKVNEVGVYTVKSVSGSKSKEKEVLITAEGQVATVELTYELVLFDGGDNTGVTGGWTKKNSFSGYGNVEVGSTINIYGNTAYGGASEAYQTLYITNNKINLSNLNTLIARTTLTKEHSALFVTNSQKIVGWWPDTLTSTDCPAYTMVTASTTTTNVTVDLSSVSGSYYIGLLVDGAGQIVTPRVWLE